INQVRELREENGRLREELGRSKVEIDTVKARVTTLESEKQASHEQIQKQERLNAIQANQDTLMQSLRRFGAVSKNERGIIVTLPESIWSAPRAASLLAAADAKLIGIAEILAANPDYRVAIEAHTDGRGTADELQSLTDQRSTTLRQAFLNLGVQETRLEARGLGSTLPIAPNSTAANRAKNRRVTLVLVPAV
ncbi:MAG: OmpA family protein, partial [Acidobacteria bacterium]|nr:OmpA family protein [Acidobacteriota bacterium]